MAVDLITFYTHITVLIQFNSSSVSYSATEHRASVCVEKLLFLRDIIYGPCTLSRDFWGNSFSNQCFNRQNALNEKLKKKGNVHENRDATNFELVYLV